MNLSSMALRSLVWACACSEWNKRAIRRIHHSLILGSTTAICSPSLPTSFFLSFAQCFSFLVLPGRLSVVVRPSAPFRNCDVILPLRPLLRILLRLQSGWGGWPTGNIEKLSNSQVCCLAQLCLAAAKLLSISCATSTPSTLYSPDGRRPRSPRRPRRQRQRPSLSL